MKKVVRLALIPQPLLPKWAKGSRIQSPSPALGEGFRVRAYKGCFISWTTLRDQPENKIPERVAAGLAHRYSLWNFGDFIFTQVPKCLMDTHFHGHDGTLHLVSNLAEGSNYCLRPLQRSGRKQ